MSAGKLCSRAVVIATPEETVRVLARRMAERNVGTIIVLGDGERPIGIVTDRDIALRCVAKDKDPDVTTAEDLMTEPIESITEETSIEEALARMATAGTRRLPVVMETGRLAGILALDDILDLLAEEAALVGRLLEQEAPAI